MGWTPKSEPRSNRQDPATLRRPEQSVLDRLRASPDEGSYDHVVREEIAMTVEMMTLGGAKRVLDATAVDDLRSRMRGSLLTAADDGYDAARRIWNAMIDKRPALIARCAGAADVFEAVRFAAAHEMLVSVRGGGHNVAGTAGCDNGLMVDLSPMKGIRVDPVARTARAQPRLLWQGVDHQKQGLWVPAARGGGGGNH